MALQLTKELVRPWEQVRQTIRTNFELIEIAFNRFTAQQAAASSTGTVTETNLSFSDVTTADVSITKHGLAPKAPNDATRFLDGTGAYTVPAGAGTVTHTGTLSDHAVVVGNGGADVSTIGLGTTTTVLHGNASGDPGYSAVVEGDLSFSDITTANVSTSAHGLAPKAPNDATKYLDGSGAYSTPGGGSGGSATISSQTTTLTHAQISGLNATPIDVVTAGGSGKINHIVGINTASDCSAGAYNNPTIRFRYAGDTTDLVVGSSNTLNNTTKRVQNMTAADIGVSTSAADNKAIQISASIAVTGGNAANQYRVVVLFTTRSVL